MKKTIARIAVTTIWLISVNYYILSKWQGFNFNIYIFLLLITAFVVSVVKFPSEQAFSSRIFRLNKGNKLLVAVVFSTLIETALTGFYIYKQGTSDLRTLIIHAVIVLIAGDFVFFSGMLRVYFSSVQLGIRWRLTGLLCGFVPILNLIMLYKIISVTKNEVVVETEKHIVNSSRAEKTICKTKYPILFIHGVFFRDMSIFNYWGRVPAHLKINGAEIHYGEHESAAPVEESGIELSKRIVDIVNKSGCEKVNIIAHSKGGLDSRYAISCAGADKYVASLTTVNTPHRGCMFADYLLGKISPQIQSTVAGKYNSVAKLLGDRNPDFIRAVKSLTSEACTEFNEKVKDVETVYYQSIGSKMNRASSGRFPLNFVYRFVKHFDGENDGLVAVESMKWGESFKDVVVKKGRGVSHGDIIDLNRENISDFDIREFYAEIVSDLKNRGF